DRTIGSGHVFFIAPNVSPESQTVLLKASYDNSANKLRADQLLKARVIWEKKPGLTVPTEAVVHQAGEDFIFLAQNAKTGLTAKQVPVHLGDIEGSSYQVVSGVKPGDKVIVYGVQNLSDNAPISITQ
ncbi:MAG: efflux RND transporter periplasmic adaptor subunit, partial [Terriglobales bacterium]